MSKNREIEAKTLLTQKTYEQLKKAFTKKADFYQENYYFDTQDRFLKTKQISLRIRIYSDHAEQTMKVPTTNPVQKSFHETIEINDSLPLTDAQNFVDQANKGHVPPFKGSIGKYIAQHFPEISSQLTLFTWSKTRRILQEGPDNCELTLDQTSYPDSYQDYELEIENSDPALIQKVLVLLEKNYQFKQNKNNTNQSKIARASIHSK